MSGADVQALVGGTVGSPNDERNPVLEFNGIVN